MNEVELALQATLASARARDWAAYRLRFAALRQALRDHEEELVRRSLDVLTAAAPEHDAEGCLAELEALAAQLRIDVPTRPDSAAAPAMDLRGLQPPEPIVRIFAALDEGRTSLRVILPHEPVPLYNLLRERGYRYSGAPSSDGGFEVLIERAQT